MLIILIGLFISVFTTAFADSYEELFLRGNQLYMQEKYAEASALYEKINNKSSHVWHNLGNCAYKQRDYLNAYVFWKRAAHNACGKHYKASIHNIHYVETLLKKERTTFDRAAQFIDRIPVIVVQIIFLFFWCILLWVGRQWYKRKRWLLGLLFLTTMISLTLVGLKYYREKQCYAFVNSDQISVFIGPDICYQSVGQLPYACKVDILEQRDQWCKIKNKNIKGWVAKENLLLI